jgi:hypothetical protein
MRKKRHNYTPEEGTSQGDRHLLIKNGNFPTLILLTDDQFTGLFYLCRSHWRIHKFRPVSCIWNR